tara:strand:+ start:184 stop:318 length:135 start_codon:yes stop_codon:yes gene_type:complete
MGLKLRSRGRRTPHSKKSFRSLKKSGVAKQKREANKRKNKRKHK